MLSSTVKAWFLGLTLAVAAVGLPQRVGAASHNSGSAATQRARRHFLAGKRAFEAKRYAVALKEFEAGYAIEPRPGFLLNMGHAARRMGELRRARDYYLKFLESDPPAVDRRSTIALVVEIDRQLASAQPAGSHASVTPEPAVVPPPRVTPPPLVETAAVVAPAEAVPAPSPPAPSITSAAVSREDRLPEPPPALPIEPHGERALTVRATSRAPIASPGALPLVVAPSAALVDTPAPAREETTSPIYRRWWFWAGTGVAAAAVTAVLIGTLGAGSSARDSGSWGQLKL